MKEEPRITRLVDDRGNTAGYATCGYYVLNNISGLHVAQAVSAPKPQLKLTEPSESSESVKSPKPKIRYGRLLIIEYHLAFCPTCIGMLVWQFEMETDEGIRDLKRCVDCGRYFRLF